MSRFTWLSLRSWVCTGSVIACLAACSQEHKVDSPPVAARPKLPAGQVQVAKASLQHLEIQPVSDAGEAPVIWAPAQVAIRDDRVAEVIAPAAGRISEIKARVGDAVKAGAPLATMTSPDAARIRTEFQNARVELSVAQAEARRQRAMFEKGIGIESERVLAEAKLKQAQHQVESASRAASFLGGDGLDTIVLRAPRDGVIIGRNATTGGAVEATKEPLFKIGDPAALWVVADVFESDLAAVKEGAPVQIKMPVLAQSLQGKVQRVGASLDAETRRASVFVTLDEPNPGLRAGMLANAGIQISRPQGVTVPMTAVLIKDGQRTIAYVQRQETLFEAREVKLGPPMSGSVPVLAGLQPGDRVVVKGALLLDGAASQLQ